MSNSERLSRPRFEILPTRRAEEQADHHYYIAGIHRYTFNQVEGTEQWRQSMLGPQDASGEGAPR